MTLQDIRKSIDKKIEQNEKIIKYTYYELRVKEDKSIEDTELFIKYAKMILENLNYSVYTTGQFYSYQGENKYIDINELLVAIKQ
ncbi:MAG: hypothetical protein IJN50_00925 [Clostridia bacterium]|nr:hypothetical protein [Clostridia bacterium]